MKNILISIIMPIYNSKAGIKCCLGSMSSQLSPEIQIIVVDNGSSDESESFLKENYPNVVLIRNHENLGAAAARNQGLELAEGKYVMFIDCDVALGKDFFTILKTTLRQLPRQIAGVSPKIIDKNSGRIFSCGLFVSSIYRAHDIGRGKAAGRFPRRFTIDGPNSCCAVFKREYLEKIKENGRYFDEDFFFLFEDADLTLRLKQNRYASLFVPNLICYHRSGSSGFSKQFRRFLCFRNRWYMILKYNRGRRLILFLSRSFLYDFSRTLHFAFTNRYFTLAVKDIYKKIAKQTHIIDYLK
ncbi:MAG: glycosyltransferase family 2 protein [Candidatus Omnitrophota bacterium]